MVEDINLNIIDLKDMEDKINKDIEDGSKAFEKKIGVKVGIIQKYSFDPIPHMIVKIIKTKEEEDEEIWLEVPAESFQKGDYSEGMQIEIIAKNIGTIVGECDFGKLDHLSLYVADYVKIIEEIKEIKIGMIKKSSFDEDGIHAIVVLEDGNKEIFIEGPVDPLKKGDYVEGTRIEIIGKYFGTIVGEWEFGDLGVLPLFNIENVIIIKSN